MGHLPLPRLSEDATATVHSRERQRVRGQRGPGRRAGEERTALLVRLGNHSWFAEEESVVLTVRWPSVPGYAVPDEARGRLTPH
ncbi:hypothetical protein [Streptomyces flavofungini]|uniref:hypothetical protein n=1 Tax=Streptomyces flavofungini TaxID=68200 RepID=UPI003F8035DF